MLSMTVNACELEAAPGAEVLKAMPTETLSHHS
jgi:hypothetical protein